VADFSLLDRPNVRQIMFYPRREGSPQPAGGRDLSIPAGDEVRLHARIYPGSADNPTIVFFHGNGEVVADYDEISLLYAHAGLNLVVSDYRGYGQSTGSPVYTAMMSDAHAVKSAVLAELDTLQWLRGRYLMGRSLGALSALELASTDPDGLRGLIMESGASGLLGWARYVAPGEEADWQALAEAQRSRLAAVGLPLLTIHGAQDELIPVERALEAHEVAGSAVKELLVVPGAGHNDLLYVGMRPYFESLTAFVARCEQAASTEEETQQ
jgi:pimeloyl-ACP methyl ester carboxylesterase